MKLLIVTQKVDRKDPILGFFHRWIEEFAKHHERVIVICLQKGEVNLPFNVRVLSLGKEEGEDRLKYLRRFYKYIWQERKNYDAVFVHMNPLYVVLAGWYWCVFRKKIGLWYVHRHVDLKLKMAVVFARVVFSSTPESFKIRTKKVKFLGHGIDTKQFQFSKKGLKPDKEVVVLHVGRITPIKNCDTLINAFNLFRGEWAKPCQLIFVGEAIGLQDRGYQEELKQLTKKLGLTNLVQFKGSFSPSDLLSVYKEATISVNLTPTGGTDKVVLESLSVGVPVFASNKALEEVFGNHANKFLFEFKNEEDLVEKIISFLKREDTEKIVYDLSMKVRENYGVELLVEKISTILCAV